MNRKLNQISLLDIHYLAGLVDGEGSIGIWSDGKGYSYFRIQVVNTEPQLIYWTLKTVGAGYVWVREAEETGISVKPSYWWCLTGKTAEILYAQLKPILKSRRFPGMEPL